MTLLNAPIPTFRTAPIKTSCPLLSTVFDLALDCICDFYQIVVFKFAISKLLINRLWSTRWILLRRQLHSFNGFHSSTISTLAGPIALWNKWLKHLYPHSDLINFGLLFVMTFSTCRRCLTRVGFAFLVAWQALSWSRLLHIALFITRWCSITLGNMRWSQSSRRFSIWNLRFSAYIKRIFYSVFGHFCWLFKQTFGWMIRM